MNNKKREEIIIRLEKKCAACGFKKTPKVLEIHHRDGNKRNNQIENLLLLCPNCHRALHLFIRKKIIKLDYKKKLLGYRVRLQKRDEQYKITIPKDIIKKIKWEKGQDIVIGFDASGNLILKAVKKNHN